MRILNFNASKVMRLKAVTITPGPGNVVLTGKNKQGKTSILKSILAVLAGAKDRPAKMLHEGAEKGEITLTIGDTKPELIARLKVTPAGETLTVTTAEGAKYGTPQSIMDGLKSSIGFEPMTFLQKPAKDQATMLQKLVGLNWAALDEEAEKTFEERTIVNREAKQARSAWELAPSHGDTPADEVSIIDLTNKLNTLNLGNQANEKIRESVESFAEKGEDLSKTLEATEEELAEMEKAIARKKETIANLKTAIAETRKEYEATQQAAEKLTDIDTAPIQKQIEEAEATNRRVRQNLTKRTLETVLNDKEDEAKKMTGRLEEIEKQKRDELAAAPMPVPGLAFDANGITYNNLPLESASGAEQLIVALGIGIGMNPKLRVLLFKDASLLDTDSRAVVEKFCEQRDIQAWLEVVESDEPGAIIIEDGSVKGA